MFYHSQSPYSQRPLKEYLDNTSEGKILIANPLLICALFVAIKRKKYREKSLILLSKLTDQNFYDAIVFTN